MNIKNGNKMKKLRLKSKKNTRNGRKTTKTNQIKQIKMVSEYTKSVQEPWFSLIKTGTKVVEGRPKKGIFNKIKKDDIVIWTNDITGKIRECKTKVVGVRYYDTFYDMIETEGLYNVLPANGAGIKTVEDGVEKVYRQWYNADIENEYGVCAIEVEVMI